MGRTFSVLTLVASAMLSTLPERAEANPPNCFDGVCDADENETNQTCPSDCPTICGNSTCEDGENTTNCPSDCPSECVPKVIKCQGYCGVFDDFCGGEVDCGPCPTCDNDGLCDAGEDSVTCPNECFGCGDGYCDAAASEDSSTCATDCGGCVPQGCDGRCGMVSDGCGGQLDCGPCVSCDNDGTCDPGENSTNCATDCPATPVCNNDGTCDPGETEAECPGDCGAQSCTPNRPAFTVSSASAPVNQAITFTATPSLILDPPAPLWDLGNGTHLSGSPLSYAYPAAGIYNAVLTATESQCGTTQLSDPLTITVTTGASTCDFSEIPPDQQVCCGNGICDGGEGPNTCGQDCPSSCGDGVCTPGQGETSETCATDCCLSQTTCAAGCAPLPAFSISDPLPAAFEEVTFTASPESIEGGAVNWDFGDGLRCDGCGASVTHRYDRLGTFHARLTATENVCRTTQTSYPQVISVGKPPVADDAQIVVSTVPSCMQPQAGRSVTVHLRNTGGTTWSRQLGQRLKLVEGGGAFAPAEVLLPESVTVPPGGEWAFTFNFGTLGPATADYTVAYQMVNVKGNLFGEVALHRVQVRTSCVAPPPTGDYTCRASVRTQAGEPVPSVSVLLEAYEMGKDDEILRATDRRYTDVNGVANLAVSKGKFAVHSLVCRLEDPDANTTPEPIITEADPINVPIGTHIALDLTLVPDFAPRAVFPGLKPGNGVARLYQDGAYDKVVVIPTPFNVAEQTEPFRDSSLFAVFRPFIEPALEAGYDVWLMRTKTGQNIHEQAAEFAQLIDVAARRLGPNGKVIVTGYSLGGVTARLTTARYQGDAAWRVDLGVRPDLPARLIAFGDAPLEGANISLAAQTAIWTELSPNGRGFPYSQLPQGMAKVNLNSCGAQQLLRRSYPTDTENFSRFWQQGLSVRFPNVGDPFGVCDYVEGADCVCDAGPALFSVNGGWPSGIRVVAFSDGSPGPQTCYGDIRDRDGSLKNVCENLFELPGAAYPFYPTAGTPLFRLAVPFASDKDILATSHDVVAGSRLANIRAVECAVGFCGGIRFQYFGPTFIPFESALPPTAPFDATWHADYQAVHGVGVSENVYRLFLEMDASMQDLAAGSSGRTSVGPVDGVTGSSPVTVTYPNVLSPGDTTLAITTTGPTPFVGRVLGTPALYYEIGSTVETAATVNDPIEVCIDYTGTEYMDEDRIALFHYESVGWADITSFVDTDSDRICGNVTSLSPFAIFEPENRLPSISAGADRTIEAQGPQGVLVTLSAAGSFDPDRERLAFEWLDASGNVLGSGAMVELTLPMGPHSLVVRGRDPRGGEGSDSVVVTVADTVAPSVSLSVSGGRQRTLAVEAADLVGVVVVEIEVDGVLLGAPLATAPYVMSWDTTTVPDGTHTVMARARDAAGNVGTSAPVQVLVDNTPPTLIVSASPSLIWPPNRLFAAISVSVSAADAIDPRPVVRLESVTCDDGCDLAADVAGATADSDDRSFSVRAKRLGGGNGRTYSATYSASDASGNRTEATATIAVRHDQGQ